MDIVKHIAQHTENLDLELKNVSLAQRKNLKISLLGFYFLLPEFESVIKKYIQIDITKEQLLDDIANDNLDEYRKADDKSNAEVDVYAEDYEEPEPVEIFILDAFSHAISSLNYENLVFLFVGIIDVLDYYENFSDEPEFWNDLLEKEVEFQNDILEKLKLNDPVDASIYYEKYKGVDFDNG